MFRLTSKNYKTPLRRMVSAFSLVIGLRLTRFANLIFIVFFSIFMYQNLSASSEKSVHGHPSEWRVQSSFFGRVGLLSSKLDLWVCCLIYPVIIVRNYILYKFQ